MKKLSIILITILMIAFNHEKLYAVSYTWTGTTSSAWGTSTNWTPNGVPGASDNVTIVSTTNQPTYNGAAGVTNFTMTSGTLNLNGYTLNITGTGTFNGGIISNGKINVNNSGSMTVAGTVFNCKFTSQSNNIYLNGSTFNDTTRITRKAAGTGVVSSSGGNKFHGYTEITNKSTGGISMQNTTPNYPDTAWNSIVFNMDSTGNFSIGYMNTSPNIYYGNVYINKKAASTATDFIIGQTGMAEFHDTIFINNTSARHVYLGNNSGSAITLKNNSTLKLGASGFTGGTLYLKYFNKQNSNTTINLSFGSSASISIGPSSTINGAVTYTGGGFYLNGCTYNQAVSFTKNGGTANYSSGGNVFNSTASFTNAGSAAIMLANSSTGDDFNGDVTVTKNANYSTYIAHGGTSTFAGNVTYAGTYTGIWMGQSTGLALLDGTGEQTFTSRAGDYARKLKINKASGGVTLSGELIIADSLILTNGVMNTSGASVLVFANGSKVGGASDASHVAGKVKKIGNVAFTFPVGKYGQYRSIAISAPTNTTDAYTAEYFWDNSNGTYSHGSKDAGIAQLSRAEYWKLDRNTGSTNVNVTLSWENSTSCGFSNTANLKVAAWDGTTWKDKGNGGTTGTTTAGTIVTSAASTTYGAYALGTTATFDCRCYDANSLGNVNTYCLNSQSLSTATEIWYKFTTDSTKMEIEVKNLGASTTKNIEVMEIYPFCYGSIYDLDSITSSSDTFLLSELNYIPAGTTFFIRLARTSSGTGNADYNICLRGGNPGNFAQVINPSITISECGLDYATKSVRLNLRTQGGTNAGLSLPGNPENFVFSTIPSDAVLVNAYMWFTTVGTTNVNALIPDPLSYTFSMVTQPNAICGLTGAVNSNRNVGSLSSSNLFSGTCWGPQLITTTYFDDLTTFFKDNGRNRSLNGTYSITALPNVTAGGFDVSGATLMLIYKTPCVPEVTRPAKMVIWHGIETQGGVSTPQNFLMNPLGAYANNEGERAFMIVADVEGPAVNSTFDINALPPWIAWGFSCQPTFSITGNNEIMHTYNELTEASGSMLPFSSGQNSLMYRFDQNGTADQGADCFAVAVMGAYMQDGGHGCTPIAVTATADLTCNAPNTSTVALTGAVTGGTTPYTYQWTPTPNISSGWTAANATGIGINNTLVDFVVTVEGNDGCIASDDVVVSDCTQGTVAFDLCDETASNIWANNATVTTNNTILINGRFNVNIDLNFDNCPNIILGPNAYIEITGTGNVLDFKTCTLTTCGTTPCEYMWDGIYVNSSTNLVSAGGTVFENAKNAIVSSSKGDYYISGDCRFLNCHEGIIVKNYTPALPNPAVHPGDVANTDFICNAGLIPPYLGEKTYAGIEIINAYGVTVGSATAGNTNLFQGLRYGIKSYNGHLTAYNNQFVDIFNNSYISSTALMPITEGAIVAERSSVFTLSAGMGLYVGGSGTYQNNTFDHCNVGVFSDRLNAKVEYNDFTNVTQGIFLRNIRTIASNTVSYNTMDMTGSNLNNGTAIRVENAVNASSQRLTIRNNIITGCRNGIVARNIPNNAGTKPFWIYQNEIYFTDTYTSATRTGMRVENCGPVIIDDNLIDKTVTGVTSGEYSKLIGLRIANCRRAYVYENTFNDMGRGINTIGNLSFTRFFCNTFNTNNSGFFFGPLTYITNQGTSAINSANVWNNTITYKLNQAGSDIQPPYAYWYYRTPGATLNPDIPSSPVDGFIFPSANGHNTDNCGSTAEPPDAIVETPTAALREEYFGRIMRDENYYGLMHGTYRQYDNEMAYLFFKNNSGWLSIAGASDNAAYSSWYNALDAGNVGKITAIREKTDTIFGVSTANWKAAYDTAITRNNALSPDKLIETNEKTVTGIYLTNFADDHFILTSTDSTTLENIAYQYAAEGGTGVYMARIMLGIDVDEEGSNKTDDDEQEQNIFTDEEKSFIVYPNPAREEVNILFNGYEESETVIIEIYDLSGKRSINKQVVLSGTTITLNTSELEAGIYIYRIFIADGGGDNGKLIITR